jgi:hypothetical protein
VIVEDLAVTPSDNVADNAGGRSAAGLELAENRAVAVSAVEYPRAGEPTRDGQGAT